MTANSVIVSLPSLIAIVAILSAMALIAVGRPALGMIFFFVFLSFGWRLVSVGYIDTFGPLASEQLERNIGRGMAAIPLAISQGLVIIAILFSFRPSRLRELYPANRAPPAVPMINGRFTLSDFAFGAIVLFTIALWGELLWNGSIPLFSGLERGDYTQLHGGPLHRRLMDWGTMLAFQLGVFAVAPTLNGGLPDRRFAALFVVLLLYLFLVGHRFSAFYAYGSFFIIPVGAALLGRGGKASGQRLFSRTARRNLWIGGGVLGLLILGAIAYSYIVVRKFEGAQLLSKLSQRVMVQQGEMWWMTYERVFVQGNWMPGLATYKLFVDPFDPARNSTMQLLMELGLPPERAHFVLNLGTAYTGGWPEVCFELGGPIGGFVLVGLMAILFSEFMFLTVRCIVEQRFATCFFFTPILFALSILVVSGMVNSFVQVTFVIKSTAALVVYVLEDRWQWRSRLASHRAARVPPPASTKRA